MKKVIAVLLTLLISLLFIVSCGKDAYNTQTGSSTSGSDRVESTGKYSYDSGGGSAPKEPAPSAAPMPEERPMGEISYLSDGESASYSAVTTASSGFVPVSASVAEEGLAEKIIYSVYAEVETRNFDETIDMVNELIASNNAFIENSYIGGVNYAQSYYGWQTFRSANFTLRIPKNRLNAVTASLGSLGNVTSLRSDAENITSQFFDTQSRLNSYRTQEERLLDMLSKADNVPDMIAIEQRLADVRYNIESLTTTLNNWQSKVDYSTLTLYISEVEIFTEITPVQQRTYWQQIGDGLLARIQGIGRFFMKLFKWLTVNLPVLIIIAVIVVVIFVIVRRRLRRSKERES